MNKLLVMSCSQSKVATRHHQLPADSLYDGPGWRVLRRWRREHPIRSMNLPVLVLSAEYGLIPAQRMIEPYNRKMDPERAAELGYLQHYRTELLEPLLVDEPDVLLYGGKLYADCFGHYMPEDYVWRATSDGARGIGDMLGELKTWLGGVQ